MYLGLVVVLVGETLLFGQVSLLLCAAITWGVMAAFVRWYEEPTLTRQFDAEYATYRGTVPAWKPRLRPWTAGKIEVDNAGHGQGTRPAG